MWVKKLNVLWSILNVIMGYIIISNGKVIKIKK